MNEILSIQSTTWCGPQLYIDMHSLPGASEHVSSQSLLFGNGCFIIILLVHALSTLSLNIDFRRRLVNLLGFQFSAFAPATALSMLQGRKEDQKINRKRATFC